MMKNIKELLQNLRKRETPDEPIVKNGKVEFNIKIKLGLSHLKIMSPLTGGNESLTNVGSVEKSPGKDELITVATFLSETEITDLGYNTIFPTLRRTQVNIETGEVTESDIPVDNDSYRRIVKEENHLTVVSKYLELESDITRYCNGFCISGDCESCPLSKYRI